MLFKADIQQNLTLEEVNLETQDLSPKSWKHETKVDANPKLS